MSKNYQFVIRVKLETYNQLDVEFVPLTDKPHYMLTKYQNDLVDLVYKVAETTIFKDLSGKHLRAFVFFIEAVLDQEYYCYAYVDIESPLVNKASLRSEVVEMNEYLRFEIEGSEPNKKKVC